MSNVNAVAVATEGLKALLQRAFDEAGAASVTGAKVGAVKPNAIGKDFHGVNVFLYQITPNAALRNEDLPTRRPSGELMRRPQLAIDLHYLLSFIGDDAGLDPQRILGAATAGLHAHPELTPEDIDEIAENAPADSYLRLHNDLAQQVERVRFSLAHLDLEDLSKLWMMFPQKEYELSVAVQASVLLLEAPLTPVPSRAVLDRGIYSGMPAAPELRRLAPQITPRTVYSRPSLGQPLTSAPARLVLDGAALRGESTRVRIGDLDPVAALSADEAQVQVEIPAQLRAGIHAARVLVAQSFSNAQAPRRFELESNALPFVLEPRVIRATSTLTTTVGGEITVGVEPAIGPRQQVRVIVADRAIVWTPPPPPAPFDGSAVTVKLPAEIGAGTWPLRVEVDGATGATTDPPDTWISGSPAPLASVEVT